MSIRASLTNLYFRHKVKPKPGTALDHLAVRHQMDKLVDPPRPVPAGISHTPVAANADKQLCPAEYLVADDRPADSQLTILYFHGGGYFFCSLASHRPTCSLLAKYAKARVLSVDYRLAPEHPCPAAIDDGLAWYRELLESTDAKQIVFAGDSAGGGLAMSCLLAARDAGLPLPAAVTLYSPWVDLTCSGDSMQSLAEAEVIFAADSMRPCAELYLQGRDPKDPLASALYADLSGLPPLQVFASEHEILLSDSTRLQQAVEAAGGQCTLSLQRKLPHAWPTMVYLPEAQKTLRESASFMRKQTARS